MNCTSKMADRIDYLRANRDVMVRTGKANFLLVPAANQLHNSGCKPISFWVENAQNGSKSGVETRTEPVPCWWKRGMGGEISGMVAWGGEGGGGGGGGGRVE